MEQTYKVEVTIKDSLTYTEEVKALTDLEALDIVHAKYKDTDIIDIKVVE